MTVTTACSWDKRVDFDILWRCVKRVLKPRGVFLTTANEPFASLLRVSNLDWYRYDWVWDKKLGSNFALTKSQPFKVHENVLVFSFGTATYYPQKFRGIPYIKSVNRTPRLTMGGYVSQDLTITNNGDREPISILEFSNANQSVKQHPTAKPVALYEYLIRTYTQPGDLVLDPFCGSGTTGLAALRTGRRYILGDSEAGYVDLARQRIANADPFQSSKVAEGVTQLSLFDSQGKE